MNTIERYVARIMAESAPDKPLWNIEKIHQGKINGWNYIDGCMMIALLNLYRITGEKKFGYKDFDVFMLAKGDKILGDNSNHTLKFVPTDEYIDEFTGKPVYGKVIYEYETEAGEHYRITYDRKGDISRQNFIDLLPGAVKLGAKLVGFEGSYLRFEGEASVERIENGEVVERVSEPSAVWELMYFGKAGADKGKNQE